MEPNTPQPGRIPTPASLQNKLQPGIQESLNKLPQPAKTGLDIAVGAGITPLGAVPVVAGKMIEARIKSQNIKGLESMRRDLQSTGRGRTPVTKKRITKFGAALFISFAAFVDVVEAIIDIPPATPLGVIVNRIIDIVVGLIFILYALYKGLSISDDWGVFTYLFGTIFAEFVPILDALPFFTADAWMITRAIKKKDLARQAALDQEAQVIVDQQNQQNWMRQYADQQAAAAEEQQNEMES